MKRILKIIPIVVFVFFALGSFASGASDCWRFMHNDHDTLLIGEIIQIISGDEDAEVVIRATSFIVSANNLHEDGIRRQLRPYTARVINIRLGHTMNVGDYVIASLNQYENENRFVVAWGIFPVDSLNFQSLTISPENPSETSEMHTYFVNSGGRGGQVIFAGEEINAGGDRDWALIISIMSLLLAFIAVVVSLFALRAVTRRGIQILK